MKSKDDTYARLLDKETIPNSEIELLGFTDHNNNNKNKKKRNRSTTVDSKS
jgi:hypothetical protein